MSTRGSLVISGKRYVLGSDSGPSFARPVLTQAMIRFRQAPFGKGNASDFIRIANKFAGHKWIDGLAPKSFKYPFEEYQWAVNLRTGKITGSRMDSSTIQYIDRG